MYRNHIVLVFRLSEQKLSQKSYHSSYPGGASASIACSSLIVGGLFGVMPWFSMYFRSCCGTSARTCSARAAGPL